MDRWAYCSSVGYGKGDLSRFHWEGERERERERECVCVCVYAQESWSKSKEGTDYMVEVVE